MNAIAKLFPQAEPASTARTLEKASPKYAEVKALNEALCQRINQLDAERVRLARKIATEGASDGVKERDVRIAELAGLPKPALTVSDKEQYADVLVTLAETKEAARLVALDLQKEWLAASALICEQNEGRHRALMIAMFAKMSEVHALWVRHEAMIDDLRANGIAFASLRPQSPDFLGRHPGDKTGELAFWMRDLVAAGFVKRSQVPELYR